MLPLTVDVVRTALHVLGAALWVGGLAAVVLRLADRRLHLVAWAGGALTLVTGVWALLAVDVADRSTEYLLTLGVKLLVVAVSAAGAAVSVVARDRRALGAAGLAALVAAVAAVVLGVQLSG